MGNKSKTIKIPKRVAGVKIPKKLRKLGGKAVKLADAHPVIADVVAAGLLAAAAALTADRKKGGGEAAPDEEENDRRRPATD